MIRTVLGNIEKPQTGSVLIHEHIQCISNDMLNCFGKKWFDTEKIKSEAINSLKQLKTQFGVEIFVDGTPIDLGRNVKLLKELSLKSGVNIIASTGLYYFPSMLSQKRSAEELSNLFIYECEFGMEDTNIKPGILKCAVEGDTLTHDMQKREEALAITQEKTGLPLYVHCSHKENIAFEAIKIFNKHNVNQNKIIIGHASRRLNTDYLKCLLKEGFYICIDQSFSGEEDTVAKVIYELCEMGYQKKLLLSHDAVMYNDFNPSNFLKSKINTTDINRFSFLYKGVIPSLKNLGFEDNDIILFIRNNALNVLDI